MFVFLATYKYYDGIIWPEILDDKEESQYWVVAKAKSIFGFKSKSSSAPNDDGASLHEGNIKSFSNQDHIEFRKYALNFYLNDFVNDFARITSINKPVEIVRMVFAVYVSVSSSYLYYDKNEHIWNPSCEDIAEVSKQHMHIL